MTPEQILALVPSPTHTRLKYGQMLYEFITTNHLSVGLELKSFPDISTIYIAGAIEALETGHLRSVCEKRTRATDYDTLAALKETELNRFVSLYQEPTSYNWCLMKFLQEDIYEHFDFCVIDGGATWAGVGFACCLVERLLKPGGWIIINNLNFNFRASRQRNAPFVTKMAEEEQITRQVRCAYDLLLQSNPLFGMFRKHGSLALARKMQSMWSSETRSKNKREVTICNLVDRARHDPDFRAALISSSYKSRTCLPENMLNELGRIRFIDTDQIGPLPTVIDSGTLVVPLERPSWENRVDEATLEAMLEE